MKQKCHFSCEAEKFLLGLGAALLGAQIVANHVRDEGDLLLEDALALDGAEPPYRPLPPAA